MVKQMRYKPSNTNVTLKTDELLTVRTGKEVYLIFNDKRYILDCIIELPDRVELFAGNEVKDYALQKL